MRLHGIDCPEKKQPFGTVGRQRLSALIFGQTVAVHHTDTDRYGRTIAIVFTAEKLCVNEALLADGLASHYTRYDHDPRWASLAAQARSQRRGLWADPAPIAPWAWRRGERCGHFVDRSMFSVLQFPKPVLCAYSIFFY